MPLARITNQSKVCLILPPSRSCLISSRQQFFLPAFPAHPTSNGAMSGVYRYRILACSFVFLQCGLAAQRAEFPIVVPVFAIWAMIAVGIVAEKFLGIIITAILCVKALLRALIPWLAHLPSPWPSVMVMVMGLTSLVRQHPK